LIALVILTVLKCLVYIDILHSSLTVMKFSFPFRNESGFKQYVQTLTISLDQSTILCIFYVYSIRLAIYPTNRTFITNTYTVHIVSSYI